MSFDITTSLQSISDFNQTSEQVGSIGEVIGNDTITLIAIGVISAFVVGQALAKMEETDSENLGNRTKNNALMAAAVVATSVAVLAAISSPFLAG